MKLRSSDFRFPDDLESYKNMVNISVRQSTWYYLKCLQDKLGKSADSIILSALFFFENKKELLKNKEVDKSKI